MKLIGIDGCAAGWVLAAMDEYGRELEFALTGDLDAIFREARDGRALVAIDVPIGLPQGGARGCDLAARRLLRSPRASSVFPAPPRPALAARSYAEACELSFAASGRRLSRQAYGILPKIRDVDRAMTPEHQANVREAHPEVTFAALAAAGRGLVHGKKTGEGEQERLRLLARWAPVFSPVEARARLGYGNVQRDDIVDAVACLVTALRLSAGRAMVLPDGPAQTDARGLRMEIVA